MRNNQMHQRKAAQQKNRSVAAPLRFEIHRRDETGINGRLASRECCRHMSALLTWRLDTGLHNVGAKCESDNCVGQKLAMTLLLGP